MASPNKNKRDKRTGINQPISTFTPIKIGRPEQPIECGCRFENEYSNAIILCDECSKLSCHLHMELNEIITPENIELHEKYNFKNQPERLKYIGKRGNWHQFEKISEWGVWTELLDTDLHMIEKTK